MNPTAPQPAPKVGEAAHSVDLVMVDLAARKEHGIAKYGVAHQHDNGRDHLVDLYQELLDATVYARAEIEGRREERVRAAAKVRRWIAGHLTSGLTDETWLSLEALARSIEEGP